MADKKVTALTDIGTGIAAGDVWMVCSYSFFFQVL